MRDQGRASAHKAKEGHSVRHTLKIAVLASAFGIASAAAPAAAAPVPYHELALLYESCVDNARQQMPEDQLVIGKALCFCRAQQFASEYEYEELVALAKSRDDFNAASQSHLDSCKPQVEGQLDLKPTQ